MLSLILDYFVYVYLPCIIISLRRYLSTNSRYSSMWRVNVASVRLTYKRPESYFTTPPLARKRVRGSKCSRVPRTGEGNMILGILEIQNWFGRGLVRRHWHGRTRSPRLLGRSQRASGVSFHPLVFVWTQGRHSSHQNLRVANYVVRKGFGQHLSVIGLPKYP